MGFNKFLKHQLVDKTEEQKELVYTQTLARIYAFSFEGAFYNLPRPAIFLVHGPGKKIGAAGTYDDKIGAGPR